MFTLCQIVHNSQSHSVSTRTQSVDLHASGLASVGVLSRGTLRRILGIHLPSEPLRNPARRQAPYTEFVASQAPVPIINGTKMLHAFCILFLQRRMKDIQNTKYIEGFVNNL